MSNKPQPLLGAIGGVVAGTIVKEAVGAAVDRLAKSPKTSISEKDKAVVAEIVAEEVAKELGSRAQHTTNQEPFYKSRVSIGAIGSIFSGVAILLNLFAAGQFDATQLGIAMTSISSGVFALYGRWAAKKPMGE